MTRRAVGREVVGLDEHVDAAVTSGDDANGRPIRPPAIDVEQVGAALVEAPAYRRIRPSVPSSMTIPASLSAISTLPSSIASNERTSPIA